MIDYNKAAVTYDNSRSGNERVFQGFCQKVDLRRSSILDFDEN